MAVKETTTTTESTESALEAAEQSAEAEAQAEQQAAEQEEASKIDNFLRSRGVPGRGGAYDTPAADDSDDGEEVTDPRQLAEEGEDDGEEAETGEEEQQAQPTEEELMGRELEVLTNALDQVEGKGDKGDEGEEQLSAAEIGFRRREESRRLQQTQSENEQLRNYLNAVLSHMQQTGQQTAQPQKEGADETPEPDLFEDPNAYIDHALKERLAPYEEKLQRLDVLEQRQQSQEMQQHVRKAETDWEQEHPGYVDRLAAYRRAFVAELQHFGLPLPEAQKRLLENEQGIIQAALQLQINPAELMDRTAHRWIGGAAALNGNGTQQQQAQGEQQQQAQKPQKPAKAQGKFDRARQAANSAAAGTLSEGAGGADGGEIDADTLLASGASPDQIHTVLSRPGGRHSFFELMSQLERAADAPDE